MTLPEGWIKADIEDVSIYVSRGRSPSYVDHSNLPVVNQRAVRWNGIEVKHLKYVDPTTEAQWSTERFLKNGDILWNSTGTGTIGRAALFNLAHEFTRIVVDSHVTIIRCSDLMDSGYLFALIRSPAVQSIIEDMQSGSTNQVELNRSAVLATTVPLPPLAEQHRIVAKLDALTNGIARTREDLDRVPKLAERLRQETVRAAFGGSLTAKWRATNGSGTAISAEILSKAYQRVTGSSRRNPAAEIEWTPTLEIPPSWRWVSVDQAVALVQYGSSAKTSERADGVPVLRMGNIQQGKVDWADLKYLPQDHKEFPKLLLELGDILFNRTNSFELVGKSAVCQTLERPTSFASYLIRIRPSGILPDLLSAYLNSPIGKSWIENVASQQVGQANVNGSKLKALGIPLPPFEEQAEILRILKAAFARANRLEEEAAQARALIDRLESSILTKAFRGELVPQYQTDEPASILLERIRAERHFVPSKGRQSVRSSTSSKPPHNEPVPSARN